MNIPSYLKARLAVVVEEVKNTLPEGIEFDFRKHVLPLFLPFMAWKDELRDRATLQADLMAGLVGAIIVLPQGLAFAMIAGLPPVYGLYTAMVTPIVAALSGFLAEAGCNRAQRGALDARRKLHGLETLAHHLPREIDVGALLEDHRHL